MKKLSNTEAELKKALRIKKACNCLCDYKEKRHQNPFVSLGPRKEKFTIISNHHGRTQKCDFSVLDRKYKKYKKSKL